MLIQSASLAWLFFKEEYLHSHQKLLRWTQGLLFLFMIVLSQTSASIQSYLTENLNNLLGADAVISQQSSLTAKQLNALTRLSEKIVLTEQMRLTLTNSNKDLATWQSVKLKAVSSDYPLQGQLKTSSSLNGETVNTIGGPSKGELWLDARAIAGLSLNIGDYLIIAQRPFVLTKVLVHEPDRLMEGHTVEMRGMINPEDVNQLNIASDLIDHRYLIQADNSQISALNEWQKEMLPGADFYHKKGRHPLATFWQRTENLLGLLSLVLFFMATVAINQLTKVHNKKDQYLSAVCLSFGLTKKVSLQVSLLKWLINIVMLLPLIWLCAAVAHYAVTTYLQQTFVDISWQVNFLLTLKVSIGLSLLFFLSHVPVWLSLTFASQGQLFRRHHREPNVWLVWGCNAIMFAFIIATYSDNLLLTSMLVGAMIFTGILIKSVCWLGLTLGEKVTQHRAGVIPFTLFMMKQRLGTKSTQMMGVGLCAFLMLFTLMLLKDIGSTMGAYQRQHDGNVMISQATKEQLNFIEQYTRESTEVDAYNEVQVNLLQKKPFVYAKLTHVNNTPIQLFQKKPSDSMATLSKAIRLHGTQRIPKNNRVIEGQWWQEQTKHWQQISVESEVMTDLGLNLGDKFTFYINQQSIEFTIVASHVYQRGHGSITFWVQMPLSAFNALNSEHYYMASMKIADTQWGFMATLWQKFPTLRMVSLKELTQNFDNILTLVTQIISAFSVLIIILASVVILASVKAYESQERKKHSIIMSFGFSQNKCLQITALEWFFTALIAASGAIVGTVLSGFLIYQSQFFLNYQPDITWLVLTLLIVIAFVVSFGVYASKHSLRSSVRELLSEH